MKLERIVVGVDGSTNSLAAVEWAAALARITGGEVIAVHALGLLEHLQGSEPISAQSLRQEIRDRFETEWCAPLNGAGIQSRKELLDGSPITVLLKMAEDEDADLIVVGSRGLGGYPELLLGSTSTQVAQNTSRPVTIVPTPPLTARHEFGSDLLTGGSSPQSDHSKSEGNVVKVG